MKKILIINGSGRKKNTFKLLKSVEEILTKDGFECEIINLYKENIKYCCGCEQCILKDTCFIDDNCKKIMQKIINCDGLIIGSPVYMNNMSGILKTFFDRTCSWFHRSPVYEKPTLIILNTQGSGINHTLKSIKEVMIQWGVYLTGSISRNGINFNKPIDKKELSGFIKLVNINNKSYTPSFKEVYTYNIQRVLSTNVFPLDKKYWEEHNLLNNTYFKNSKLTLIKKIFGNTIYKILCKVLKPNKM